jgi:uncharacterized protein (DUF488 family)
MKLYTVGFTKKSAERFFALLRDNRVQCLVDIRVHPNGQLAGFTKQADLPYFLIHLAGCGYCYLPALAPSEELLTAYRKDHDWGAYVTRFEALMDERGIPQNLDRHLFEDNACCLLCSEATPDQCHRRLVAERLARAWPETEIVHLL